MFTRHNRFYYWVILTLAMGWYYTSKSNKTEIRNLNIEAEQLVQQRDAYFDLTVIQANEIKELRREWLKREDLIFIANTQIENFELLLEARDEQYAHIDGLNVELTANLTQAELDSADQAKALIRCESNAKQVVKECNSSIASCKAEVKQLTEELDNKSYAHTLCLTQNLRR